MTPMPWHASAWQRLTERRQRDAMPHALLLSGPPGLGKRAFLERLVRGLLCQQPTNGDACGQCRTCRLLDAGTHPDRVAVTFELNKSGKLRKEIVVDQMRDLGERLAMASQLSGWQVASIDPADGMNKSAANALLKTLEEPTRSTLIVLVADAPWRLMPTIRSRCQSIEFRMPETAAALAWLQENGVADAAAALKAAGGNPGLALTWSADGLLEERRGVRDDLVALASGKRDSFAVMRRWTDGEALAQRLWFAAQMAAMDLRARTAGDVGELGSRLDDEALGQWFDRANRAREALRGPLRPDLVVLELLGRWR